MAVIHNTTLVPSKLDIVAPWLPSQPWYAGDGKAPELARTGGFRLDDPEGEVGIEFMVVTDTAGDGPRSYLVPLTYRAAPLDGADDALIGTMEHGVLGRRFAYDGTYDPVLRAELLSLLALRADPQMQSVSDAVDPDVVPELNGPVVPLTAEITAVEHGPDGTDFTVQVPAYTDHTLHLVRVLDADTPTPTGPQTRAHLTAHWRSAPDESSPRHRGVFAVLNAAVH